MKTFTVMLGGSRQQVLSQFKLLPEKRGGGYHYHCYADSTLALHPYMPCVLSSVPPMICYIILNGSLQSAVGSDNVFLVQ